MGYNKLKNDHDVLTFWWFLLFSVARIFRYARENFPEVNETKNLCKALYSQEYSRRSMKKKLNIDPLEDKVKKRVSNVIEITSTLKKIMAMVSVGVWWKKSLWTSQAKVKRRDWYETFSEDWTYFYGAKVENLMFWIELSKKCDSNINLTGDYPIEKLKEIGEYFTGWK